MIDHRRGSSCALSTCNDYISSPSRRHQDAKTALRNPRKFDDLDVAHDVVSHTTTTLRRARFVRLPSRDRLSQPASHGCRATSSPIGKLSTGRNNLSRRSARRTLRWRNNVAAWYAPRDARHTARIRATRVCRHPDIHKHGVLVHASSGGRRFTAYKIRRLNGHFSNACRRGWPVSPPRPSRSSCSLCLSALGESVFAIRERIKSRVSGEERSA